MRIPRPRSLLDQVEVTEHPRVIVEGTSENALDTVLTVLGRRAGNTVTIRTPDDPGYDSILPVNFRLGPAEWRVPSEDVASLVRALWAHLDGGWQNATSQYYFLAVDVIRTLCRHYNIIVR